MHGYGRVRERVRGCSLNERLIYKATIYAANTSTHTYIYAYTTACHCNNKSTTIKGRFCAIVINTRNLTPKRINSRHFKDDSHNNETSGSTVTHYAITLHAGSGKTNLYPAWKICNLSELVANPIN